MTIPSLASPDALLSWVDRPRPGHGVHVLAADDAWTMSEYAELAGRVRAAARQLQLAGMRADDVVTICEPRPLDFIVAFFGVLYAGGTPLPLPARSPNPSELIAHISAVLDMAGPAFLITAPGLQDLVDGALSLAAADVELVTLRSDSLVEWPRESAAAVGLLQCTSGSTGSPRGVRVTCDNLVAQVRDIACWHRIQGHDALASWLPLHHDMGLAGVLLTAVLLQVDLWQLTPEQFLGNPARWLHCLNAGKATITAAPTFGYAYAARRTTPEQLVGLDFSQVKSMIVGAERLAPVPLRAFANLLTPHGLTPRALRPAYGLAEATLAVTGTDLGHTQRLVDIDWSAARPDVRLPLGPVRTLMGTDDPSPVAVMSCGRVLEHTQVRILDDDGIAVPEGFLGEIAVTGASVAAGYIGGTETTVTRFDQGELHTGDAGFLLAGELYVVGRVADSIKVRGRRVYVETIEQRVAADHSLSVHRCVAIPITDGDGHDLALLLENVPAAVDDAAILTSVRAVAGPSLDVRLVRVPVGTILRTTSGKVRRRLMWGKLVGGQVDRLQSPRQREPISQER